MIEKLKNIIRNKDVRNYFFRNFIKDNYKILDLGCGNGNTGLIIKKLYPNVEYNGCDVLQLDVSKTNNFIYKQVDIDYGSLPYPDEYFDAIIFTHVIEHLKYPLKIGNEINQILKHGGEFMLKRQTLLQSLFHPLDFTVNSITLLIFTMTLHM